MRQVHKTRLGRVVVVVVVNGKDRRVGYSAPVAVTPTDLEDNVRLKEK